MDAVGSTTVMLNSGNPIALSAGTAVLTRATLNGAGSHTITSIYNGVSGSFQTSTNSAAMTISKNSETVSGPATQPVQVAINQGGSVPITDRSGLGAFLDLYGAAQRRISAKQPCSFGEALFEVRRVDISTASGPTSSANALAMQFGRGLNIGLRHGFGLRAFEVDYVRTNFRNSSNDTQNDLRFSMGVTYHIGKQR